MSLNRSDIEQDTYNELCGYTLMSNHPDFIHQHVVDAYAAQHADEHSKPIGVTFALVGLYLMLEKNFTGRQVQLAHMKLAKRKLRWPTIELPGNRGAITVIEVMAADEGADRERAIQEWCASVWNAFAGNRQTLAAFLREHGIID